MSEKKEHLSKRARKEPPASTSTTPTPAGALLSPSVLELAGRGDGEALLRLLADERVDVRADPPRAPNGDTALHVAAGGGHVAAVVALLGAGAHVDAPGHRLRSPLHCAVAGGHLRVARRLLDAGSTLGAKNVDGVAPVDLAVRGSKELVQLFLEKGVSVDACNEKGESLLVQAAKAKQWKIVEYLLERGASPGRSVGDGALELASESGQPDAVRRLLRGGASRDAEQVKAGLQRAADAAVVWAFADAAPRHVSGEAGRWGLLFAARDGRLEALAALLEAGVDVNAEDSVSGTALYYASANGQLACVRELVARGADVNAKDKDGRTPLHWAAQSSHAECVRVLLAAGASPLEKNSYGQTPLDLASTEDLRNAFDGK